MRIDVSISFGSFAAAGAPVGALGAANLGIVLAVGQIALASATVLVIVKHP